MAAVEAVMEVGVVAAVAVVVVVVVVAVAVVVGVAVAAVAAAAVAVASAGASDRPRLASTHARYLRGGRAWVVHRHRSGVARWHVPRSVRVLRMAQQGRGRDDPQGSR